MVVVVVVVVVVCVRFQYECKCRRRSISVNEKKERWCIQQRQQRSVSLVMDCEKQESFNVIESKFRVLKFKEWDDMKKWMMDGRGLFVGDLKHLISEFQSLNRKPSFWGEEKRKWFIKPDRCIFYQKRTSKTLLKCSKGLTMLKKIESNLWLLLKIVRRIYHKNVALFRSEAFAKVLCTGKDGSTFGNRREKDGSP